VINNMKAQFETKMFINLLVISMTVVLATSFCSSGQSEHEVEIQYSSGYYSFDPKLDVELLGKNDEVTFKQLDSVDNPIDTIHTADAVLWDQDQFLYVMKSFHNFLWQEKVGDGWNLLNMEFRGTCESPNSYFYYGSYYLFKTDSSAGRIIRKTHRININLMNGAIWWSESELYPLVEQWKPIELVSHKIPISKAISIAESNGGFDSTFEMRNDCVKIINGYYDEWRIAYYSPNKNKTVIEFFVNNNTGEYREVIHE